MTLQNLMVEHQPDTEEEILLPSSNERRRRIILLVAFFSVITYLVTFPLFFYPYDDKDTGSQYYKPLHPGENFAFNNRFDPFWYESVEVSTDAPPGNQQLVFFDECPKRNVTRSKSYNIDLQSSQWFRLNKGSSVNLTWETSEIVTFTIFSSWEWSNGYPSYSIESDGQTDFLFEATSSDYYNFHWPLDDSRTKGVANFRFNLSTFDTSVAQKSCPLLKGQSCKFHYTHDSSCIVVDYYNLKSNEAIPFEYIKVEGKGRKYFGIVMFPLMVVGYPLWGLCLFFHCHKLKEESPTLSQEDEGDPEGQTELNKFLGQERDEKDEGVIGEREEESNH